MHADAALTCPTGSGEFGEVYKAKWHGSYVAAKVLKRSDEIALGDFRTEIAILRKIHHPNCVQVRKKSCVERGNGSGASRGDVLLTMLCYVIS